MSRSLLLFALLSVLTACEETEDGITGPCGFGQPCAVDPIAGVHVTPPNRSLVPGDTTTLSASVVDTAGLPVTAPVAFETSDSAIAVVATTGLLRAIAPGAVTITARAGAHAASVTLTIQALLGTGVSAGEDLACLTTNVAGRSQCWGLGDAGQLGFSPDSVCFADDTLIGSPLGCAIAPGVIRRDLDLISVSVGDSLACALDADGSAWCWGSNRFGQLGIGSISTGDGPQRVTAFGDAFTLVRAGGRHACGIAAGITYCWGEDSLGQLGDARRINSTTPIPVVTTDTFTYITTGMRHTCALNAGGEAFCWGNDESGQLGRGGVGGSADAPTPVQGGHLYTAIAAGDSSTCAIRADGAALCWGANSHGQLGRGTTGGASGTPVPVIGGNTFTGVDVGLGYACATGTGGDAYCWGRNDYGQLGSPSGDAAAPRAVGGGITFAAIATGARHVCAVTSDGAAYCWGSNVFGALGNRLQAASRGMPVAVSVTP